MQTSVGTHHLEARRRVGRQRDFHSSRTILQQQTRFFSWVCARPPARLLANAFSSRPLQNYKKQNDTFYYQRRLFLLARKNFENSTSYKTAISLRLYTRLEQIL